MTRGVSQEELEAISQQVYEILTVPVTDTVYGTARRIGKSATWARKVRKGMLHADKHPEVPRPGSRKQEFVPNRTQMTCRKCPCYEAPPAKKITAIHRDEDGGLLQNPCGLGLPEAREIGARAARECSYYEVIVMGSET